MKKYILTMAVCAMTLVSCKDEKPKKRLYLCPPAIELTQQDTTDIMQKVEAYVSLFGENRLKDAAEQLYFVRNDSIFPLDNEKKEGFIKGLSIFHIYDTKVEGLIIRDAMNNEVCVTLQIMKDGDIKQNKGVTKFYLNPVKINGKWYMTLRDKKAEGVMKPY